MNAITKTRMMTIVNTILLTHFRTIFQWNTMSQYLFDCCNTNSQCHTLILDIRVRIRNFENRQCRKLTFRFETKNPGKFE